MSAPLSRTASSRSRKIKAILASGVVLGVGAVVTLAAWTDSEFATGTFTAGTFNAQGSTTSATEGFSDHASADGAANLTFDASIGQLAPDENVFLPMWVRLAAGTDTPASLELTSVAATDTIGGNSEHIVWAAFALAPTATCDASAVNSQLLAAGTTLASVSQPGTPVVLNPGAATADAGTAVQVCFVIEPQESLEQGGATTATWQMTVTST